MIQARQLAQLCQAAYMASGYTDAISVFGEFIGRVGDNGCSAIVARIGGETAVAFQGTELDAAHWREVVDDLDAEPTPVTSGGQRVWVHSGFFLPLAALWPALATLVPDGGFTACGHSLGGARANLLPLLAPARVVTFGAPRITATEWTYPAERYIHERDPIPDVPWGFHHSEASFTWLRNDHSGVVTGRPIVNVDIGDHALAGYITALSS